MDPEEGTSEERKDEGKQRYEYRYVPIARGLCASKIRDCAAC